mmetsp:Transcript_29625/g.64440  ORF Transcript_29625/g.64440 Transcript_29625/m.64440 type:complete len:159 (+) Transcript_29625:298-774(+)
MRHAAERCRPPGQTLKVAQYASEGRQLPLLPARAEGGSHSTFRLRRPLLTMLKAQKMFREQRATTTNIRNQAMGTSIGCCLTLSESELSKSAATLEANCQDIGRPKKIRTIRNVTAKSVLQIENAVLLVKPPASMRHRRLRSGVLSSNKRNLIAAIWL